MKFFPLVLGIFAAPGLAPAFVVNIDFNFRDSGDPDPAPYTYGGHAAAPDSASTPVWNSVRRGGSSTGFSSSSGLNSPPLETSTGTSSGLSVVLPGWSGGGYDTTASLSHGRSVGQQEIGASGAWELLMGDYLQLQGPEPAVPGDPIPVVTAYGYIAGLTAGSTYDIYFYAQGPNPDQNSSFALRNGFGPTSSVIGSAEQTGWSLASSTDGVWTEGMEYVKLTGQANSSGRIDFSWSNVVGAGDNGGANSRFAILNAMQIVSVVPEPSSALLGMLGMAGLFLRRRR